MQTVAEKFIEYDAANPAIYEMFQKFALDLIAAGRKRLSGRMLIERVRWETSVAAVDGQYKINDKFLPHYVRKLIEEHPWMAELFELRTIRTA